MNTTGVLKPVRRAAPAAAADIPCLYCGARGLTPWFAGVRDRLGFEVHGLDVQPDVVRYLREELAIPAECADVSEMARSHPPGSFDLITTFFLIEHIPDVRGAIAAMYGLLKPGGWLAAAVPFA